TFLSGANRRRKTGAVGILYHDVVTWSAYGLIGDAPTVRGPDRKPVLSFERQPTAPFPATKFIDPDGYLPAVVECERDAVPIGREPRMLPRSLRNRQDLGASGSVEESDTRFQVGGDCARDIRQRAICGD